MMTSHVFFYLGFFVPDVPFPNVLAGLRSDDDVPDRCQVHATRLRFLPVRGRGRSSLVYPALVHRRPILPNLYRVHSCHHQVADGLPTASFAGGGSTDHAAVSRVPPTLTRSSDAFHLLHVGHAVPAASFHP